MPGRGRWRGARPLMCASIIGPSALDSKSEHAGATPLFMRLHDGWGHSGATRLAQTTSVTTCLPRSGPHRSHAAFPKYLTVGSETVADGFCDAKIGRRIASPSS
jgi:hypothetical protein